MAHIKRRIATALIFLLLCVLWSPALAATWSRFAVEQYAAVLPELYVFGYPLAVDDSVSGEVAFAKDTVSATLGGTPLEVESFAPYAGGTTYYFLLDISGSVSSSSFRSVKEGLQLWLQSISPQDRLVLITFGDTVTITLNGSEEKAVATDIIEKLRANDNQTLFYDAVATAVSLSNEVEGRPVRNVAMVFTDGKDVSEGGSITRSEVLKSLQDANLPLYAFGIGTNKQHLDALGEFARSSGGRMYAFDRKTGNQTMQQAFVFLNSCCLLKLRAPNNVIDAPEKQLIVQIEQEGGSQLSFSSQIVLSRWLPDSEPPRIDSVQADGETILVRFSEDVTGADKIENYTLMSRQKGSEGDPADVQVNLVGCVYSAQTRSATLKVDEPLYAGGYSLTVTEVFDVSVEQNPLAGMPFQVKLEGQAAPAQAHITEVSFFASIPWWAYALIALVLAGIVAAVLMRKKPQPEPVPTSVPETDYPIPPDDHIKIVPVKGARVQIKIVERSGIERSLSLFVSGRYIIGRSDQCNLSIADNQLSRTHCALFWQDGLLCIEDLGSTNGTEVNGIRIHAPRKIVSGDVVEIGNTKLVILN